MAQINTSPNPVHAYARSVLRKRAPVVAGPHVRAACSRHLDDLKDGGKRGLRWEPAASARVIAFFRDVLKLKGGQFEGRPFELLPWQCFLVGSLFGWVRKDGTRRFRRAYVEGGKGCGKSPVAAGIALYMLCADAGRGVRPTRLAYPASVGLGPRLNSARSRSRA